jgi:hypothetical protein
MAERRELTEKIVRQMLWPYVRAIGVPQVAPHDLRRTTAMLCPAAGGEPEQIQMLLGHSSVQTHHKDVHGDTVTSQVMFPSTDRRVDDSMKMTAQGKEYATWVKVNGQWHRRILNADAGKWRR